MLLGVSAFGNAFACMTVYVREASNKDRLAALEDTIHLSSKAFDIADKNRDGYLSRADFITYTLVKYGAVDEDTMQIIHDEYNSYDGSAEDRVAKETIVIRQSKIKASRGHREKKKQ